MGTHFPCIQILEVKDVPRYKSYFVVTAEGNKQTARIYHSGGICQDVVLENNWYVAKGDGSLGLKVSPSV